MAGCDGVGIVSGEGGQDVREEVADQASNLGVREAESAMLALHCKTFTVTYSPLIASIRYHGQLSRTFIAPRPLGALSL